MHPWTRIDVHRPVSNNLSDARTWPSALGFDRWSVFDDGSTYDMPCACFAPNPLVCFRGHQPVGFFGAGRPSNLLDGAYKPWGRPCTQGSWPNFGIEPNQTRFIMEADNLMTKFERFLQSSDPQRPIYAQVSFRAVHVPYVASPELRLNCSLAGTFPLTSICNYRNLTSKQLDYAGAVYSIDLAVGRARRALRNYRPHDWNNTVVIFTSDNGPESPKIDGSGSAGTLRGLKRSLFEGGIRTPSVLEWPAMVKHNAQVSVLVSILDIPVTAADIITNGDWAQLGAFAFDGVSLLSLLKDPLHAPARSQPLLVCGAVDQTGVSNGDVCPNAALIDHTGAHKLIFKWPPRAKETRLDLQLNPPGLYLVSNEFAPIHAPVIESALQEMAATVIKSLKKDFLARCAGYM
jgi:hypothetical protein